MLTASQNFKDAISSVNRKYDIMVKLYRNTSGGSNPAIDISDRVISYQCTYDFESRSGRLTLEIDNYDYQLSPLQRDSTSNQVSGVYDPLFDSNHRVELFEGVLKSDGTYEYVKKFVGYLGDEIGASADPTISLSCRDKSKLLQDRYIYQGPSYSLYLVEEVIQDLLNTFASDLNITLSVPNPTQYMVGRPDNAYTPKDTNLWDAIQLLADSASMELRFLEDATLTIRPIIRDFSNLTPSLALDMSSLVSDSMSISDADVRNYIVVKVSNFDPITKQDDYSISKYGLRYMEVQRSMSDLITDVSQAHELAENMLRDLRFAYPSESAEIPFNPLIQVGDIVQIFNPRLGTNMVDDIFKVMNITNEYSKDRKRTRLSLQGYDKFLSSPDIPPNAPTAVSFNTQSRTIQNYTNSGWTGYEKETSFPMIRWIPPSLDISGNILNDNFGGYVIERASKLNKSGNAITTDWIWGSIASVPSFIGALGKRVDYFYDYSSMTLYNKYIKAGYSGNTMQVKYRLKAIGKKGAKSAYSSELIVDVPTTKFKDKNGNYL